MELGLGGRVHGHAALRLEADVDARAQRLTALAAALCGAIESQASAQKRGCADGEEGSYRG